jgi:hypothetical protein
MRPCLGGVCQAATVAKGGFRRDPDTLCGGAGNNNAASIN